MASKPSTLPTSQISSQPSPPTQIVHTPSPPNPSAPENFDGTRSQFGSFVTKLQLQSRAKSNAFSSEESKILYAGSYLTGDAYVWFEPHADQTSGNVSFTTFAEFLQSLRAASDDPGAYAISERQLEALQQEASPNPLFSERAEGECITLDSEIFARIQEKKSSNSPESNQTFHPLPTFKPTLTVQQLFLENSEGDPIELDNSEAGKAARKAYRRANNLCGYCGRPGHRVANCHVLEARSLRLKSTISAKKSVLLKKKRPFPSLSPFSNLLNTPHRVAISSSNFFAVLDLEEPQAFDNLISQHHRYNYPPPVIHTLDLGNEKPLAITAFLQQNIPAHTMIDSGASTSFIDELFIKRNRLRARKKLSPETVRVVDRRQSSSGHITLEIDLQLQLGSHSERLTFQVTRIARYHIILGKSWLSKLDPEIKWSNNVVSFTSPFCQETCLVSSPVSTYSISTSTIPSLEDVTPLSISALLKCSKRWDSQIFSVSIKKFGDYSEERQNPESEESADPRQKIPLPFHEFLSRNSDRHNTETSFKALVLHVEHGIRSHKTVPERKLEKGFIEPSTSSFASPVLFVKKPGGGLCFCVDYRALNAITRKNVHPLPRIDDSLRQLLDAKIFTRLDLRGAYNQIRIKPGDEPKTAFRTRSGLYQYKVMPFSLTNAPATCQQFVNDVLREYLDIFVVVYLDGIQIHSKTAAQHEDHVRKVLQKLQQYDIFCKPEKCEFGVKSTTFLGFVVSPQGLSMDPTKFQTIEEWKPPTNVRGVQSFLGFANFYRRFIKDYSKIASPLFALTRKDSPFLWTLACQSAFYFFKTAFISEPILRHFDPLLETVLETDASAKVISAVLSQYHSGLNSVKKLHPTAYFSRTMSPAELNYTVGDKETLAIVESLREYRRHVSNLTSPVQIITDHQNLTAFTTKRILNGRQARWALELAETNFRLEFRPGCKNSRADALTRRSEDLAISSRPKELFKILRRATS
ncbi:hypothetical protein K3495_g4771 [Podosphaera aphanis]|nr:hypothetical protein K3495_g4771 [Podosphaera aphanis]